MILIHDFGVDLETYHELGKNNDFPMVEECPHCHAKHSLHRHGFYERNAITAEKEYRLLICRFRCSICFQTVSILPHFLLPYFQHTTRTIVQWLHDVLHQTGTNPSKRQLISFYLRRFIQTISWIYMYFASVKKSFGWERDTQQQARRSIGKIQQWGEERFVKESWGYLSTYFMAHCFGR
ncbi:DUF6431 domain-containing protein [Ureibacillus terrenus]|uniref:DUF6431 domain-containing protein n=1 Tax=Ureibacillus terrenus TaxID=118246 RepID=UPI002E21D871|nr:DUF6431 domain-containing protein [Ureibacillus terrenus]